jgi:hypothetical protein
MTGMTSFHRGNRRAGGALLWSLATIGVIALWGGLWWWVKYGSETEELDPNRPRRFKVKQSEMKEGIYVHARGVIRIVAGDVEIHVRPHPDSSLEMYAFPLSTANWLTPEQEELSKVGRKVGAGGKFVETHKIAPEQVERARQLSFSEDLALTEQDRARLVEPFRRWQETDGEEHKEAEKVLLATAKEVGAGAVAATRRALINDIEQVPALLTQEQWQNYLEVNLGK